MRRSFAVLNHRIEDQPISGINTTPLIDVMLVLLVMFIIIIPAQFHAIPLNLPQPGPVAPGDQVPHRLTIDRGGNMTLDGVAVEDAMLAARLTPIARDSRSALTLHTDADARYDRFAHVLAVVKRAGITRLGFEGNKQEF